jgi:hypothetical protein
MTGPPTLSHWKEWSVEQLEGALERSILARLVADLTAETMRSSRSFFGRLGQRPALALYLVPDSGREREHQDKGQFAPDSEPAKDRRYVD